MRRAALLVALLLVGGGACQSLRGSMGAAAPGVGVLVQGIAGDCAPVVVGSAVRRVCLRRPERPDSATTDSSAVTR